VIDTYRKFITTFIMRGIEMKKYFNRFYISISYISVFCFFLLPSVLFAQQYTKDVQIKEIMAAMRSSDFKGALTKADTLLAKKSKDVTTLCLKGEILSRLNDPAAALETFEKVIKINKNSVCAVVGKATALQKLNKEDEYTSVLKQARTMKPVSAYDFLARGKAFSGFLEDDKAIADFDQCLKLDSSMAEANLNKAMVLIHKGDFAAAIEQFSAALKADPNYKDALTSRASAYNKKGDTKSAIAAYSTAIQIYPDDEKFYYNRGVIYLKQQNYDNAIADFSSAIKLQPIFPEAYVNRGVAYTAKNKWADAKNDFQKAVEQDPAGDAGKNGRRGLEMLKNHR
jgi:tetratricopeptide (TPR) repeat protein